MNLKVDKMSSWWKAKLTKCQVDKMPSLKYCKKQNAKLTKCQVDKMSSRQNVKLTKCQADKISR